MEHSPLHFIVTTIVSGGQTGADRAALDWAMESGYRVGGWCPQGRKAEDGPIDPRYPLMETESQGYRQRTRRNVNDSDGTLIVNVGALDGGSLATLAFAQQLGKPCFVAQLDDGITADIVAQIIEWVHVHPIITLNVAGPREGKRPGIYRLTRGLLGAVATAGRQE